MKLLRTLTLIYTGVLVLAVAASGIAILVYLLRIAAALREVHEALATVAESTAPLAGPLTLVRDTSKQAAEDLTEVHARLARADEHLAALAEQLGATERAR